MWAVLKNSKRYTFHKKYHGINVKAIGIKVTAIYLTKSTKYPW